MGSRSKDSKGGDDGEGSEGDEAEPVQHLQDCDQLGLWLFPVNVFGIIVTDPSHSLDNPDPYDVDFKPDRDLTMAANFQSFSMEAASSSSLSLDVITWPDHYDWANCISSDRCTLYR